MKRIYLDNCCLKRVFDDQSQDRVRFETDAVAVILDRVGSGELWWVGSTVLEIESERKSNEEEISQIAELLSWQSECVVLAESEFDRADELQVLCFKEYDALHLAAAEKARCDVLLTTDDRLLARSKRVKSMLRLSVKNPVDFLLEELTQ